MVMRFGGYAQRVIDKRVKSEKGKRKETNGADEEEDGTSVIESRKMRRKGKG